MCFFLILSTRVVTILDDLVKDPGVAVGVAHECPHRLHSDRSGRGSDGSWPPASTDRQTDGVREVRLKVTAPTCGSHTGISSFV